MKSNLHIFLLTVFSLTLLGCKPGDPSETEPTESQVAESNEREKLLQQKYSGTLRFLDENNNPIENVSITIAESTYASDKSGNILIPELIFGNHSININHDGYLPHTEVIQFEKNQDNKVVRLITKSSSQISLLFAGDTMFGRRYLDPLLKTMTTAIPNVEGALIRPDTASEDAIELTKYVAAMFKAADFTSVNLESPVTDTPEGRHPTKEFTFFSLPETLEGIKQIGVDYVALGNNHVYDYLEDGLDDTIIEVNAAGFLHSGAGKNNQESYEPLFMNVGSVKLGLLSATSIPGKEHQITYVSSDTKGGAADLTNTPLILDALAKTSPNSDYVIMQMHGGDEYSYSPTPYIKSRYTFLSNYGVDLFVTHHPHIAQGFALSNGVPSILGLGNFMFDGDRLETFMGIAVMVKIDKDQDFPTERAVVYPIYVEEYQPKFTHGALSDSLIRRIAYLSDDNISIIPRDGYADLYFSKNKQIITQTSQVINVEADQSVIDLRNYAPSTASFMSKLEVIEGSAPNGFTLGHDMMIFGDFEDWDGDEEQLEVNRWDHTAESVTPCITKVRTNQQALCSDRTQFDNTPSIIPFRETIRAMELTNENDGTDILKTFSLYGYINGTNAGKVDAKIVYTTERDALEFATNIIDIKAAGTYSWEPIHHKFTLPPDTEVLISGPLRLPPRGVKVTFRHYPPDSGEGNLALDDMAMISWQNKINLSSNVWTSDKMHAFDFLYSTNKEPMTLKVTYTTFN